MTWKISPGNKNNHYGEGDCVQPIEYFACNYPDSIIANIIKYIVRHKKKNGKEDLEKAIWYTDWLERLGSDLTHVDSSDFTSTNDFDSDQKEIIEIVSKRHIDYKVDPFEIKEIINKMIEKHYGNIR